MVSALAGVRYGTIFVLALILTKIRPKWLRESFRGWQLVTKAAATLMAIAGVVLVGLADGKQGGTASTAMKAVPRIAKARMAGMRALESCRGSRNSVAELLLANPKGKRKRMGSV